MNAKTRLGAAVLLILVASLVPLSAALAKGQTDKITITGSGLAEPIEIVDPESLEPFGPHGRRFVDWTRRVPDEPPHAYKIYFYDSDLSSEPIYVVHYSPGVETSRIPGRGYFYFPGIDEPEFKTINQYTIGTNNSDRWDPNGKWNFASAEADATILSALDTGGMNTARLWAAALVAIGLLFVAVALLRRRLRAGSGAVDSPQVAVGTPAEQE